MARYLLLPGFGGRYANTFSVTEGSNATSDELDMSRCAEGAVEVTTYAPVSATQLTLQPEQSFDGTNFASFGSPVVIAAGSAVGTIIRFEVTDGPLGILRVKATSAAGDSEVVPLTLTFYGTPLVRGF